MRLILVSLFLAMLSACSEPEHLHIGKGDGGLAVIHWDSSAAMGLYVTSPASEIPGAPGDKVKGGHVFWVLEATTFPSGFDSPVTFGHPVKDSMDATAKHGGMAGGEPLVPGQRYKFSVVTLGGQRSIEQDW